MRSYAPVAANVLFASLFSLAFACSSDDPGDTAATLVPNEAGSVDAGDTDTGVGKDAADDQTVFPMDVGGQDSSKDVGIDADGGLSGCGDGVIETGEKCDDGNSAGGDGCAADCLSIDKDYVCPKPGEACVYTVKCGDGIVSGNETCDDNNTTGTDGCSATCQLESGWKCPTPGARCEAAKCGDGIVAGHEQCDDSNGNSGDGCSATCKVEDGWDCGNSGLKCHKTVCNDGNKEGNEPCDDGNQDVGDGCSPFCEVEPSCTNGACKSSCGDGILLPGDNEECDDGNSVDGDGCSAQCKKETGFACSNGASQLPNKLIVPATYHDVIALPKNGSKRHPDFEIFGGTGPTTGMVQSMLGSDGTPTYTGICEVNNHAGACPNGDQTTSKANFASWFHDTPGVNIKRVKTITLTKQPNGSYYYPTGAFFPLDGDGWITLGKEDVGTFDGSSHNFGFTTKILYWFQYAGGEVLNFRGDDDVWVFINRHLAVDLGGLHGQTEGSVTLDAAHAQQYGLQKGKVYQISLFHAERHTYGSTFNLTLSGFVHAKSTCHSICGDGIVVGDEVCDDGVNDGSYGSCLPGCLGRGPYCGDGVKQGGKEECDDGVNLTTYGTNGVPGCGPGCKLSSFCGDGVVDGVFGEQCDDGKNAGGYGGCTSKCQLDIRCGDGVVQQSEGEQCDDGNTVSGDGCDSSCKSEAPH